MTSNYTDRAFIAAMSLAVASVLGGCDREGPADTSDLAPAKQPDSTAAAAALATEPVTPAASASSGMMAMMDGNGDGMVTAEEHGAAGSAMFATLDADSNG